MNERSSPISESMRRSVARPRVTAAQRARMRAGVLSQGRGDRRWRLAWAPALVAAAAALGGLWLGRVPDGRVPTNPPPNPTATAELVPLGPHSVRPGPRARMRVIEPAGTRVHVQVDEGWADFAVAPLGNGRRFRVSTPHLRVEVVGTRFRVMAEGRCTSVEVSEGTVRLVDSSEVHTLTAGMRHQSCVPTPAEDPPEQLLREAMRRLLAGEELDRAEVLFRTYLAQLPERDLAPEARFGLWRVAQLRGDQPGAEARARGYLEHSPHGAHADRVRAWLDKTVRERGR